MARSTRKPEDGFRILSSFDVQPSSMDSRSLQLNWRWNSTELAKQIVQKTKITHFSDVGLTVDDEYQLTDPTIEGHKLENLQPDTRYTVCIQITRNWHRNPGSLSSGTNQSPNLSVAQRGRTQEDPIASNLWSHVAPGPRDPVRTVTERECRVTVTSWLHWPALISSLVGILIAILISFSIFLYLKRAQSQLKKARREQKKAFCTDHAHTPSAKHSDTSVLVTCPQGHEHKCPHHRCPNCHLPATYHSQKGGAVSPSTASSTSSIGQPPHHHHHHYHHHHHHRHPHRSPHSSGRHQSPCTTPFSHAAERSGGEQTGTTNPVSGDLLSIDMAQSLSGSDSYQFSSTSSADDRLVAHKSTPLSTAAQTVGARTNTTNSLAATDLTTTGRERKRTVSFLLSERRKSLTEKLRSKSIEKSILDGWYTRKLQFGFRKPKKQSSRHSVTDYLTNIPQVTVTIPDIPEVSHTVLEPRSPTSERTFNHTANRIPIATNGSSPHDAAPATVALITETITTSGAKCKTPKPPKHAGNVLSPIVPEKDAISTTSSIHGSERDADTKPAVIPVALSVVGFKVALDSNSEPSNRDATNDMDRSHPIVSASTSPTLSSPWDRSSRPISPPACTVLFERAPTQTPQDSSIFFTQLIETL